MSKIFDELGILPTNGGEVNIGTNPNILHIIGAGSTNATQPFFIENSSGNDLLTMKDDGSVIFNDAGLNTGDFTVEGDTDTLLFKTNASENSVGIGLAGQAAYKLYVDATNETRTGIAVFGSNTVPNGVSISTNGSSTSAKGIAITAGNTNAAGSTYGVNSSSTSTCNTNYGLYARTGNGTVNNYAVMGQQVFAGGSGTNAGVYGIDSSPNTIVKHGVIGGVQGGTFGVTTTTYAVKAANSPGINGTTNYGIHGQVSVGSVISDCTNYAGHFGVTNGGSSSGNTNYGVYIDTITSAGTNTGYGLVVDSNINSGFGTITPDETLHVVGSIKMVDGNQADGYVLTSDANGVGTWEAAGGGGGGGGTVGGTGTVNTVSKWSSTTGLTDSQITDDGTTVSINNASPATGFTFYVSGDTKVVGSFEADSKSFDIAHPSDPDKRLRYGSLEGPEYGVYVRGKSESNIIELPDYWVDLIHEDTITVQITPIGRFQSLYVGAVSPETIEVLGDESPQFYYVVYGERKDINKIIVEY